MEELRLVSAAIFQSSRGNYRKLQETSENYSTVQWRTSAGRAENQFLISVYTWTCKVYNAVEVAGQSTIVHCLYCGVHSSDGGVRSIVLGKIP